jgi:hypothetical protein
LGGLCLIQIIGLQDSYHAAKYDYDLAEFEDLPLAEHAGKLWVIYGHRSNAGSSIYKIHDAGYLAERGYRHAYYKKYRMDLALLQLAHNSTHPEKLPVTLAGTTPSPPGDPSYSSAP